MRYLVVAWVVGAMFTNGFGHVNPSWKAELTPGQRITICIVGWPALLGYFSAEACK